MGCSGGGLRVREGSAGCKPAKEGVDFKSPPNEGTAPFQGRLLSSECEQSAFRMAETSRTIVLGAK